MKKTRVIRINMLFIIIVVFIFVCIIYKLLYVSLGGVKVGEVTLTDFASARDTRKKVLTAKRGTIYSSSGEVLAKDVNSYTVIAYLDSSRTKDPNRPYHVVDKEKTAETLAPLINMKKSKILDLLNTMIETCNDDKTECVKKTPYQVELGPGGRGITELLKDKIEDLGLPGIDFIASTKRYYPNSDFLSYTLGYAKMNDNQEFAGEMGVELYYNDELTGTNGYIEYQSDIQGYQITSSPTVLNKSISGNDVYLTIDTNIQMFTEQALTTLEKSKPEWATIAVVEARTGKILGVASSPSFNNNTLNIKSYYDPFVSYEYEPGSTMKIFSFMAAMENGIYDGNEKYKSGSIKVDDATIKDWNKVGWGNITYDEGFMGSSNVAATKLSLELGRAKLKDFYNNLGFGKSTDISLPNEATGVINFKYNTEIATASFGQGITVSAIQMVQALTTLANEGTLLRPYIVSKIVNSETGEVILENERTEIRKVASKETVDHMISLMRGVVDGSSRTSTGTGYYIKNYDLIGKTGTAEVASSKGGYLTGSRNYVRSFAGLFPGKDPQIIVYVAASKMTNSSYLKKTVKALVKDVGTYLNIYKKKSNVDSDIFNVDTYINKNVEEVKTEIEEAKMEVILLGDGDKIIDQYPKSGTVLNVYNKVFLLTNGKNYIMPNIIGWSKGDVNILSNMLLLDTTYNGYGYVTSSSIKENSRVNKKDSLEVTLKDKYNNKEEKEEN